MFDRVVERNIDDDVFDAIKNDWKRSRVFITIDSRFSSKKKSRVNVQRSSCSNLVDDSQSSVEKSKENEKKDDEKEKKEKKKDEKKRKKKEKNGKKSNVDQTIAFR